MLCFKQKVVNVFKFVILLLRATIPLDFRLNLYQFYVRMTHTQNEEKKPSNNFSFLNSVNDLYGLKASSKNDIELTNERNREFHPRKSTIDQIFENPDSDSKSPEIFCMVNSPFILLLCLHSCSIVLNRTRRNYGAEKRQYTLHTQTHRQSMDVSYCLKVFTALHILRDKMNSNRIFFVFPIEISGLFVRHFFVRPFYS